MIDLRTVNELVSKSSPFILFIRHARRPSLSLSRMVDSTDLSILPEGAAESRRLGEELRSFGRPVVFFTSPLKRCVQTCQEILKGLGHHQTDVEIIHHSRQLGNPSAFVIDAKGLGEIMRKYETPIDFLTAWFDAGVPETIILSPKDGSIKLLRWLILLLRDERHVKSRSIVTCVSHDLIITAFLASLFGYDYKNLGAVDYLDGAALWIEASSNGLLDEQRDEIVVNAFFSGFVRKISVTDGLVKPLSIDD